MIFRACGNPDVIRDSLHNQALANTCLIIDARNLFCDIATILFLVSPGFSL